MSKKKNDAPAIVIESGKPIEIKATSREEATQKLSELRKQAETEGLTPSDGGFIQFIKKDYLDKGMFTSVITFVKL